MCSDVKDYFPLYLRNISIEATLKGFFFEIPSRFLFFQKSFLEGRDLPCHFDENIQRD
jgi:hypothetical protein